MIRNIVITLLFISSLFFIQLEEDRTSVDVLFPLYVFSFFLYLWIYRTRHSFNFRELVGLSVVAHLVVLWKEPALSIDYYRFLWDGEIFLQGFNPFDFRPIELQQESFMKENYFQKVYEGIGSMSQQNYSCYPPVNQFYFMIAALASNNIAVNAIVLKLLIVLTQLVGGAYLYKLLKALKMSMDRMWLLYLNPLWIIETVGNVHFEGVMLSFLFVAFYFLKKRKFVLGAFFFALSVHIKLVPLILLPFFWRFWGWKQSFRFYFFVGIFTIVLMITMIHPSNIAHFIESLRLYFQVFEFNSFFLYYYLQYGFETVGWNMTQVYAPRLSLISFILILGLAFYRKMHSWEIFFQRVTLAFFIYLIFSSTLHPWYILPLLTLSIFTNYRFPVVWTFTIFFSYVFYVYLDFNAPAVRWVSLLEYLTLLFFFVYEQMKGKIKLERNTYF